MISYDVTPFDGSSLKAGPKCTKVFVSNEKALVWTSSQCGIVEKLHGKGAGLMLLSTKTESFQGPLICVETA